MGNKWNDKNIHTMCFFESFPQKKKEIFLQSKGIISFTTSTHVPLRNFL